MFDVPAWLDKANLDISARLPMEKLDAQALHAAFTSCQKTAQLNDQTLQGKNKRRSFPHLGRQFESCVKLLWRLKKNSRISKSSKRAVQLIGYSTPEPLDQSGTGQHEHFTDSTHPYCFKCGLRARIAVEYLQGQRLKPSAKIVQAMTRGG